VGELERAGVELIVLLAAMHRDDAARIALEVPAIDFVVGSYGGHYTTTEDRVERNAWLLYSGNQGKRLGETRVWIGGPDGPAARPRDAIAPAQPHVSGEPAHARLRELRSGRAGRSGGRGRRGRRGRRGERSGPYAGPQACRSCHAAEHADWQASKHATALATLERQKAAARVTAWAATRPPRACPEDSAERSRRRTSPP